MHPLKIIFIHFVLLVSVPAAADLTIEFVGPCSEVPLLSKQVVFTSSKTVGELTIETLKESMVDFQGTENGLNSAFGTPTGLEAIEIISDAEMRAYGWCYSVDGVYPSEFASSVSLVGVQSVQWFFGYAYYLNGVWSKQCSLAYVIQPSFLCQKENFY